MSKEFESLRSALKNSKEVPEGILRDLIHQLFLVFEKESWQVEDIPKLKTIMNRRNKKTTKALQLQLRQFAIEDTFSEIPNPTAEERISYLEQLNECLKQLSQVQASINSDMHKLLKHILREKMGIPFESLLW